MTKEMTVHCAVIKSCLDRLSKNTVTHNTFDQGSECMVLISQSTISVNGLPLV